MNSDESVWIGADPGGEGNFGLAILRPDRQTETWCVDCADHALDVVVRLSVSPAGTGVDAPLWWSSARSSDRKADRWLRKTYGLSGGQVQTGNSLRGAVLVQGMMFVQRLRERFPGVQITETHPNALLHALKLDWDAFCHRFLVSASCRTKHERDAVISAVSAREGFSGRWTKDLGADRYPSEQDPARFWLAPVHYFWPET